MIDLVCCRLRVTAAVVLGALAVSSVAFAQPANDDCADAITIGDGVHAFSTIGATTDGPVHSGCQFGGNTPSDIWYQYTASCTDDLTVSTCNTVDYDSDIVIYDGCDCNNLTLLGCNDDGPGCSGFSSELTVPVIAGNCYLIRIGKYQPSSSDGGGTVLIQCGPPAPIGACCLPGGTCSQLLDGDCTAGGGVFQGVGAPCVPNPCSGACCATDGSCSVVSEAECASSNGVYTPDADCQAVSCTAACCQSDGTCTIVSEFQCTSAGGQYSEGADCESVECTGACCLPNDACIVTSPLSCAQQNGLYNGNGAPCTPELCLVIGPDVVYTDIDGITDYGPVGGIKAYSIGSDTCNIGDEDLLWTNNGTPGFSMNMYRLHDGQLKQIGLGWLKVACCAAAGNGCGLSCNGNGGQVLGAGCLDSYGAGYNGIQSNLMKRSGVHGYTGEYIGDLGASGSDIAGRLQVAEADMNAATYPGALYFVEGQYQATDDAASNNAMNNASYRRITLDGSYNASLQDSTQTSVAAIYAWRDHGNGVGVPDPSIEIVNVDIPLEGRFIVAGKADDLGGGQYRYTYNVMNLNSDLAAGSFSVPVPAGASVSSVGFKDIDYQVGDPYDNTDWSSTVAADAVTWNSPETFNQNQNTNALRYGTMYTFWFTADVAPAAGTVSVGLFKPWMPNELDAGIVAPDLGSVATCGGDLGDVDTNSLIDGNDVSNFVDCLTTGSTMGGNCACADMNGGGVDLTDVSAFVSELLSQ